MINIIKINPLIGNPLIGLQSTCHAFMRYHFLNQVHDNCLNFPTFRIESVAPGNRLSPNGAPGNLQAVASTGASGRGIAKGLGFALELEVLYHWLLFQ